MRIAQMPFIRLRWFSLVSVPDASLVAMPQKATFEYKFYLAEHNGINKAGRSTLLTRNWNIIYDIIYYT